jgi:hypothetical protein
VALVKHVANPVKLAQQVGDWLMLSKRCFGTSSVRSVLAVNDAVDAVESLWGSGSGQLVDGVVANPIKLAQQRQSR